MNSPAVTKALSTDPNEQINTLSLLVFKDGKLEAIGAKVADKNISEVTLTDAGQRDVILLANYNVPESWKNQALDDVLKNVKALEATTAEGDGALTMNSKLYTNVNIAVNKVNCLGWTPGGDSVVVTGISDATSKVKLYRNVAKVVLTEVAVDKKTGLANEVYPNPSLNIKEIFIMQGKQKTYLFGAEGAEYGATMTNELADAGYLTGNTSASLDGDKYTVAAGAESYDAYLKSITDGFLVSKTSTSEVKYTTATPFYVYENTDATNYTLLVVKGDFSYDTKDLNEDGMPKRHTDSDRFYPVAIGVDGAVWSATQTQELLGLREITTPKGVYRNLQYNVKIKAVGPGYQRPTGGGDATVLDAMVEVVAYGQVSQEVEI